jgi:protein-L-isoaspartate(D-aspartate) O-methyltransferase
MSRDFEKERRAMVASQIRARGVHDEAVLAAVARVPRHLFVPPDMERYAYGDEPLPIGEGQTISQPYIVAYMTAALALRGTEKVLEVGTGSGYQTAILAELSREVLTIEVVASLAQRAQEVLGRLGYRNIRYLIGDGGLGWPEEAPFDAVMVAAAAAEIPPALEEQLAPGGRLIIPVGVEFQELLLVTRTRKGLERERLLPVRFVPLVRSH